MESRMKPVAEVMDEALRELRAKPLVSLTEDGFFEWFMDGEMVYDFDANNPGDALRWIEHMAQKSWVTKKHIEQFSRLAAGKFGVGYR